MLTISEQHITRYNQVFQNKHVFIPQFIRDELKYEDGFDRHSNFHGNDDLISIDDLWKLWIQSEGTSSVVCLSDSVSSVGTFTTRGCD